jgi:hypothetical protein
LLAGPRFAVLTRPPATRQARRTTGVHRPEINIAAYLQQATSPPSPPSQILPI